MIIVESKAHQILNQPANPEAKPKITAEMQDVAAAHTIGRVSCAIQAPMYAVGALFQTLKVIIKIPIGLIVTPIFAILHKLRINPKNEGLQFARAWSWVGMTRDGLRALEFFNRCLTNTTCVVVAPQKGHRGLKKTTLEIGKTILGLHHFRSEAHKVPTLKQELAKTLAVMRSCVLLASSDYPANAAPALKESFVKSVFATSVDDLRRLLDVDKPCYSSRDDYQSGSESEGDNHSIEEEKSSTISRVLVSKK